MKKFFVLALVLAIVVSACGSPPENPTYRITTPDGNSFTTNEYSGCVAHSSGSNMMVNCYRGPNPWGNRPDYSVMAQKLEKIEE